jgi:ribulose 1,5-bisphosphate synthetase/thiazole synthase
MKYQIDAKSYGSYDVAVCGGGTAGVFAAIAAARQGARTILIERSFVVGGMLTMGDAGITKFTEHCRDVDVYKKEVLDVLKTEKRKEVQVVGGIPLEYVERMVKDGVALGTGGTAGSYIFTDRCAAQRYLINMLEEAKVEVLYDTRVCMTLKDGNKVTGVVVHNKEGFCQIDASVVIDATGDADVAAMAGAEYNNGATETDVKEGAANKVGEKHGSGVMYRVRGVDFEALFAHLKKNPELFVQHEFGVMSLENVIESHRNGEMCVFRVLTKMPDGVSRPTQVYNLPAKGEAILLGPGASCSIKDFDGLDARSISAGQNSVCKNVYKFINMLNKDLPGFENVELIHVPDIGIR